MTPRVIAYPDLNGLGQGQNQPVRMPYLTTTQTQGQVVRIQAQNQRPSLFLRTVRG